MTYIQLQVLSNLANVHAGMKKDNFLFFHLRRVKAEPSNSHLKLNMV